MENTVGKSEDSSESKESIGHFPMQLELRRSPSRDNLREAVLSIEPKLTDVAANEGGSNPTELFRHQVESVYNPTAPLDIDEKRQPNKDRSVNTIKDAVTAIIRAVGEDPARQGLLATPNRFAKAMLFLTQGYAVTLEDVTNGAIFEESGSDIVTVKGINVFSLCEHHLLPFFGKVHITYRAKAGPVIGLSKLARIVDMYARRLQIQERLTEQVALAVQQVLEPDGVDVVVECTHMCMAMRGVQQPSAITVTRKSLGMFSMPGATAEVDVFLRKS